MSVKQTIAYMRAKMAALRGEITKAVQFFMDAGIVFVKAVRYALLVARMKRA